MKNFSLLQLGKERSVVEIDGVIKVGDNYNLGVIAYLRGSEQLSMMFMQTLLGEADNLKVKK